MSINFNDHDLTTSGNFTANSGNFTSLTLNNTGVSVSGHTHSNITITAGSGLAGGGSLAANRTIDIGQGDGISVSADSIAVDSTVVRTTGTQTISGAKTFTAATVFSTGITISSSGTNVPLTITHDGTGNCFVVNDVTGDTSPFVIDASGNVGIGLGGAPNAKVQVNLGDVAPAASGDMNTGVVFQTNGASRAINIGTNNTGGYSWINAAFANNAGIADNLRLMTGATTRLTITSNGSVGVGTSSPGALFEVNGGSGAATCIVKGEAGQNAFLSVIGNGNAFLSTSLDIVQQSDNAATIIQRANAALSFWTNNTTRLTISSAGTATFSGQIIGQAGAVLTGTVAGNVRQLQMQTSGSTRWEVGPGFDAESGSNVGSTFWITRWSDAGAFLGTPIAIDRATGRATFENTVVVPLGSVSSCSVAPFSDLNTGLYFPAANVAAVVTDGVERLRVGSGGRVQFFAASEKFGIQINNGSTGNGPFLGSDGADILTISTAGGAERVRVDAGGNVGIGATPSTWGGNVTNVLELKNGVSVASNSAVAAGYLHTNIVSANGGATYTYKTTQFGHLYLQYNGEHVFYTAPNGTAGNTATLTAKMRIDASGNVLVGQSTTADPAGANTNGIALATDYISVSRSSFECLRLNLKAADGTIVALFQDAALEGSISVAGNTVSYNAFCGSHWAQLSDQSRPAILRGTVMETIDEMCDWPEDGGSSDRLVRVKVSDTPASRRVYGVFLGWDGQYASTGDMYVAGLGAYMVRVSGLVQSGDLLESAGDGTARTQADDIVRSTTIGKVSSTHRIAEYDDGSYLVPCVLMCG